jgi:cbb3-type cytochrome oxidase subunit 1
MNNLAGKFMKAAVIYGIIGLCIGVYMGVTHQLGLLTVHSHLALLGWTTLAICALYYQVVPAASGLGLAKVHFWIANIGLVILATSLVLMARGIAADPGAGIGSVLSVAALATFLVIVFRTSRRTA